MANRIKIAEQNSETKDILDKIEHTLGLRLFTLVLFFLGVLFIWWLDFFPYPRYVGVTVSVVTLWIISTLFFKLLVNHKKTFSQISNLYFIYSAIFELGFLTVIVIANGGLMWIGPIFYLFTIIYSNIILPKIKGNLISLIAFLWFGGAVCLQYFGIVPFIPFAEFREPFYLNLKYLVTSLSFICITFILSGFAVNILTDLLRNRTIELEKIKLQLEKTKAVLETRVKDRTQKLEEIASSLDKQVKKRTEELEEKMEDLKRFHNLSVGRELKMVELKEEIKKMKNNKTNLSI